MSKSFKVGDRVRHTEQGFIGTVFMLIDQTVIMVECDGPYVSPFAAQHKANHGVDNGYAANHALLAPYHDDMTDGASEYDSIIAAQELGL